MSITFIVDLDHLLVRPVFMPGRCSINNFILHSKIAILLYCSFLFFHSTRLIGLGLLIHMVLDYIDCIWMDWGKKRHQEKENWPSNPIFKEQMEKKIVNVPNVVSIFRLFMLPVMVFFAYKKYHGLFICLYVISCLTDILDGYLARKLNQKTELGALLDSIADFLMLLAVIVGMYLLWPEMIRKEIVFISIIFLSEIVSNIVGLLKFHRTNCFHTWSGKTVYFLLNVSILVMMISQSHFSFFGILSILCTMVAIEEIFIIVVLPEKRCNVKSFAEAFRIRKESKMSSHKNNR